MPDKELQVGNVNGNVNVVQAGGDIHGDMVGRDKIVFNFNFIDDRAFKARPPELSRCFDSLIAERTWQFVGREFVFKALDAFLADPAQQSGYFIIKGEPGIGKSSLMAHLVKTRGYIHHFNIALQAINKPRQFLKNICAQLIARFELNHPEWPPDAEKDGAFLNQLLQEASDKLGPQE
jgi:hypothetical protein